MYQPNFYQPLPSSRSIVIISFSHKWLKFIAIVVTYPTKTSWKGTNCYERVKRECGGFEYHLHRKILCTEKKTQVVTMFYMYFYSLFIYRFCTAKYIWEKMNAFLLWGSTLSLGSDVTLHRLITQEPITVFDGSF